MSHHPSSAELANFRRSIVRPLDIERASVEPNPFPLYPPVHRNGVDGAWSWEREDGIGYIPRSYELWPPSRSARFVADCDRKMAARQNYGNAGHDAIKAFIPHRHAAIKPPDPRMGTCGVCGIRGVYFDEDEKDWQHICPVCRDVNDPKGAGCLCYGN